MKTKTKKTAAETYSANDKERAIVKLLAKRGAKGATTAELARLFVKSRRNNAERAGWDVRNNVRRPLREDIIERVEDGRFRITSRGRSALKRRTL